MEGTLDKTFGITGPGWTSTTLGGEGTYAANQLIDNTGRILVTGKIFLTTGTMFLARYNSDGSLDNTFGGQNKGYTANGFNIAEDTLGVKLLFDSNGNIIVLVSIGTSNNLGYILTRYSADGLLDTNFGNGGWLLFNFSTELEASNMILDKSGKILVTGYTSTDTIIDHLIVTRHLSDGTIDTGFSNNGSYIDDIFVSSSGGSIILDKSNRIIVTGYAATGPSEKKSMVLLCLNSSGFLDNTFGFDRKGWTTLQISNKDTFGSSIQINSSDGDIIVSGFILISRSAGNLITTRYTKNGIINKNFGINRTGYTVFNNAVQVLSNNMVIDNLGHILITAVRGDFNKPGAGGILVRYTNSGILDTTFGIDNSGYVVPDFTDSNVLSVNYFTSLSLVDNDSRVLVSGIYQSYISGITQTNLLLTKVINISTEPICLPAGTPIFTDQGIVSIEKIDTTKNTIAGKRIVAITNTITPEKNLVCFEANSMGINCPSVRTIMTPGHEVLYNGKLVQAKHFVGRVDGVHNIPYNGKDVLYNVLQDSHGLMRVNNMIVETLHPENKVAKQILQKL
jgi:uncharacterized delta-60 repeat protein